VPAAAQPSQVVGRVYKLNYVAGKLANKLCGFEQVGTRTDMEAE